MKPFFFKKNYLNEYTLKKAFNKTFDNIVIYEASDHFDLDIVSEKTGMKNINL